MSRALLLALLGALLWAPAADAAEVLVVGRDAVRYGPRDVALKSRTITVDGRRCAVGSRTPLSLLAATRLRLRARDQGICGRSARDAGTIYVESVAGERERGRGGWVYKVGRKAGTAAAADPSGSFGTGRLLRSTDRVLWFWCELAERGCQRTLEARPSARAAAPGAPLRVTVRGYDDNGRGVPAAGATVRLGSARATTDAAGVATIAAPARAGRVRLHAEHPDMVRAFPTVVTVR